jgi:hypothetical protein
MTGRDMQKSDEDGFGDDCFWEAQAAIDISQRSHLLRLIPERGIFCKAMAQRFGPGNLAVGPREKLLELVKKVFPNASTRLLEAQSGMTCFLYITEPDKGGLWRCINVAIPWLASDWVN